MRRRTAAGLALVTLFSLLPWSASGMGGGSCPPQPVHTYFLGGAVGVYSWTAQTANDAGVALVIDTNLADCDNDGVPGDFDGDYDSGIGGGFFGYGPYAGGCGINVHGPTVVVSDVLWGSNIVFVMGEDGPRAPVRERHVTKVEAEAFAWTLDYFGYPRAAEAQEDHGCSSDGVIAPQVDPGDCLTTVYHGTGTTCGSGGGDGGYWVFLLAASIEEDGNGVTLRNPPTVGTIAAI